MSLLFNADGDLVDYGVTGLETPAAGGVAIWMYPTDDTARQNMAQGVSSERGLLAWDAHAAGDNFRAECQRATVYLSVTAAAANYSVYALNKWLFLAFRWDSAAANGDQQLLMGDLSTRAAAPSAYATQAVGSGALATGATSYRVGNGIVTTREFKGRIATVVYWDHYPTLGEIYTQQFRPGNYGGLILYSQLGWNGTGTQPDWSRSANHGTVTGSAVAVHVPQPPPFGMDATLPYVVAAAAANVRPRSLLTLGVGV